MRPEEAQVRPGASRLTTPSTQHPNPLVRMRVAAGLPSQTDYARTLHVNKGVVAAAEDGMFMMIPGVYRNKIRDIRQANIEYQAFRLEKRQLFFEPVDFPDHPTKRDPVGGLIDHFDLPAYTLGSRLCVQHAELHKMRTSKRSITENLRQAFEQIGLPSDWITEFDGALRFNARPRVRLYT